MRIDLEALLVDPPGDDLLALDEALEALAREDPAGAELVRLRAFAGLTLGEAAEVLGIGRRTADRYWAYARAWLCDALERRRVGLADLIEENRADLAHSGRKRSIERRGMKRTLLRRRWIIWTRPEAKRRRSSSAALDREPGAERAAYLDAACGDRADLRTRVEALLAAHERADEVLGPDQGPPTRPPSP